MRLSLVLLLAAACRSEVPKPEDTGSIVYDESDGDGYTASDGDCNEWDGSIHPGAEEVCDGVDNNCDGQIDEGVTQTFYADDDGDGFGDAASAFDACEPPESHPVLDAGDCDDTREDVYPDAAELCDGVDNDCDLLIDEDGTSTWYADADGDGFGDVDAELVTCADPGEGYVADATDCDDTNPAAHPGREEVCDEVDNDCDGLVDEDVETTWYVDVDGDGYGESGVTELACSLPTGYAAAAGDCDDGDAAFHPGAEELCTEPVDYNCDGSVAYVDADGDGHAACEDCDDTVAAVNPDALEVCNGVDDDCDGATDDADSDVDLSTGTVWYEDDDGDGYGDALDAESACEQPAGSVADATDCDDRDAAISPSDAEVCNGEDDDCDGLTDDDDPSLDGSTTTTGYPDDDGDGFGDAGGELSACDVPSSYIADMSDCDDTEAAVNPDATEVCNEIDDDCDGDIDDADASLDSGSADGWYSDADGDGYGDTATLTFACDAPTAHASADGDCDDTDPAVSPAARELCNGIDDDCDGAADSGTGIYSDNFEDNDISDWSIVDGAWSVSGGIVSGYSSSHTGPDLIHATGMDASTDSYTVYMTGAGGHGFGIVLGYGSSSQHCGFHFWAGSTLYLVNSSTVESNVGSLSYSSGTYYDVMAEVTPGNVDLTFNGSLVYSGDAGCDAFTRTGDIGLQVHNGVTAYFDEICVEY